MLGLVLAGCTGVAPRITLAPTRVAPRTISVGDRLSYAIVLLGKGQVQAASDQIGAVLAEDPKQPTAQLLLSEIERNPKLILGEHSHAYRVRPGETMTSMAQRFLGDDKLFYALARLNGIAIPDEPLSGRIIQIPGAAPRAIRARVQKPTSPPPTKREEPSTTAQRTPAVVAWRLRI